jgi:hypothetical protein
MLSPIASWAAAACSIGSSANESEDHDRFSTSAICHAILHPITLPLIGLGLAFLGVHYLAESIGVWWAYAGGLAITVGWSGVLWSVRRWLPSLL